MVSGALVLAGCSGSSDEGASSPAAASGSGGPSEGTSGAARSSSDGGGTPTAGGKATSGGASTESGKPAASGTGSDSSGSGANGASGAGAFTDAVAKKLGRSTVPDAQMRGAGASTGTWKGTDVGVLTKGKDTTLVVRKKSSWKVVGGWWPSQGLPGPYLGGKRHVLVLGSDARPHETVTRTRADAIQVVGLDGTGGGGVLGIPRDTRAALSTGGTGKVNSALAYGGPSAQVRTVSTLTGLPLKDYLLTSMDGFVATIDAMGGVKITTTQQIRDLEPGTHTLNGTQLLKVARERKTLPRGDIDRSANQGRVMMAVLSTMRERGIDELPAMMGKTSKHFFTSLSPAEVLTLFAAGYALSPTRVGTAVADTVPAGNDLAVTGKAKSTFTKFADGNL